MDKEKKKEFKHKSFRNMTKIEREKEFDRLFKLKIWNCI